MKVGYLIDCLKDFDDDVEVYLHHPEGKPVVGWIDVIDGDPRNGIILQDEDDFDTGYELEYGFKEASEEGWDEWYFASELLDRGYSVDIVERHYPEGGVWFRKFCEEHGLI